MELVALRSNVKDDIVDLVGLGSAGGFRCLVQRGLESRELGLRVCNLLGPLSDALLLQLDDLVGRGDLTIALVTRVLERLDLLRDRLGSALGAAELLP